MMVAKVLTCCDVQDEICAPVTKELGTHGPNVPIPLIKPVTLELDSMEAKGVIEKVTVPTVWCAARCHAPKKSGQPCICVDLRK